MSNSSAKTYSLIAVILIGAFLLAGYFVIYTFLPSYNLANAKYESSQQENARLKTAVNSVQTFLSDFESQQKNVAKVNRALPTGSPDTANFVSNLSQLSQQSAVILSNFQPQAQNLETGNSGSNTIQSLNADFSASSSYPAFQDFLLRLEQNLRLLDVYHISLVGPTDGLGTALQYQVKMRTYYQE